MDWYKPYSTGPEDSRREHPVIVFDGDDTLWETEPLYDRARSAAAMLVAADGLDPARFEELQREIDIRNVERMGLSAGRFPTSSVHAYEALVNEDGAVFSERLAAQVYSTSCGVFDSPASLLPHAAEVLAALRPTHRLVLLTKGELEVQSKRVSDSGLVDSFDAVCIVDVKSPDAYGRVLGALAVDAGRSWSVGNSWPSDIEPAVSVGMQAIWIDAPVWGHERPQFGRALTNVRICVAQGLDAIPMIVLGSRLHPNLT